MDILNSESREDRLLPVRMVVTIAMVGVQRKVSQKARFLEEVLKGGWDEI